jgi:hypothetical protein
MKKKEINTAFSQSIVMSMCCSECKKPNIFCKGMCQACYSKMQRNTEKGKERMKAYNLTAGKEAQRKFRERNKVAKPPKTPKQNCECGKLSVCRGLCMNCYQKYYQRKKKGWKQGIDKKSEYYISLIFDSVLTEVKKGFTIEIACKNANVNRSTLYRIISPIQKATLNAYKILRDVNDEEF